MHRAIILTDLTFGDAGKGTLTDALARRGAALVVRYNGGAQAAHTVLDARGRCHVFHQFGSGTLAGAATLLSRHMMVNPLALHYEAAELEDLGFADAPSRVFIDARALVTTPFQMVFNRLLELARGKNRHGSCGLGIGETASDALDFPAAVLRYGDLYAPQRMAQKLGWHRDLKRRQLEPLLPLLLPLLSENSAEKTQIDALLNQLHCDDEMTATREVFEAVAAQFRVAPPDFLARRFEKSGTTIFEGAQGVLLDENFGFHPYTTWSTATPANARQLIAETRADVQTTVLGLTRAYATRHGAGPFPTESAALTALLPDPHNPTNTWQGPFRAGCLDLPLLKYALRACGRLDGLVMTCLDRLEALPKIEIAVDYRLAGKPWQPRSSGDGDLQHQEEIGRDLGAVEPVLQAAPREGERYAREIAARLEVPLLGTSSGPTAADKRFEF